MTKLLQKTSLDTLEKISDFLHGVCQNKLAAFPVSSTPWTHVWAHADESIDLVA